MCNVKCNFLLDFSFIKFQLWFSSTHPLLTMLRAARVLRSQYVFKETTGLVGIPVNPNPRPDYISHLKKLLHIIERFPTHSVYRQTTMALTKHRLNIVENETDVNAIETKIDGGQIEELILQAKDEISLARKMEEWKPWEGQVTPAPADQWEYFERK